jgi:hypothetical protein
MMQNLQLPRDVSCQDKTAQLKEEMREIQWVTFSVHLAQVNPAKCSREAKSARNAHYSTTAQMYDACFVTRLHIHRFQRRGRPHNGPDGRSRGAAPQKGVVVAYSR